MLLQPAGYEIFKYLFKHWITDRFPLVRECYQQDNVHELTFHRHEQTLSIIMNLAYLRDKSLPATVVCDRGTVNQRILDGDMMDEKFLIEMEVLLEPFRPTKSFCIDRTNEK